MLKRSFSQKDEEPSSQSQTAKEQVTAFVSKNRKSTPRFRRPYSAPILPEGELLRILPGRHPVRHWQSRL